MLIWRCPGSIYIDMLCEKLDTDCHRDSFRNHQCLGIYNHKSRWNHQGREDGQKNIPKTKVPTCKRWKGEKKPTKETEDWPKRKEESGESQAQCFQKGDHQHWVLLVGQVKPGLKTGHKLTGWNWQHAVCWWLWWVVSMELWRQSPGEGGLKQRVVHKCS